MTMSGAAVESFLRRHQMMSLCFWITLLFAILFAMATMDVAGQCFCDPCTSTSPAITNALGVTTAIAAFFFVAQPCYGLYLLRIQCSELVSGIYIGCSALTSVEALTQAIIWGSEGTLATAVATEAGLDVNSAGTTSFKALSILAWILFALQLFATFSCCNWRDLLLDVTWTDTYDYSRLPSRRSGQVNGGKFATYQTMDEEDLEAAANGLSDSCPAHYL